MKEYTFSVTGMMCGMCEKHVNRAVEKIEGVKKVSSSYKKKKTVVLADELDGRKVVEAIQNEGYECASDYTVKEV